MKKIYIFTLYGCSHCQELKDKLTDLSIPFHDVEISKNRELWQSIVKQTGYDLLPSVFIQNETDNDGLIYTPGRDFQDLNEIIKIITNIN
jgi:glutaredoxin